MFTKQFLQQIEKGFEAQMERMGNKKAQVETVMSQCTADEAEALKCLYASMPVSDAVDYSPELFLAYAKHGVYLWQEGPFAGQVPEDIFAGYVLHHRVNNENITDSRGFFYNKIIDRIKGMSMKDAIIDINYWCSEEATYQTTDGRTACAETVYTSAYGRCGEESTFAVSIFRTMGIPARQVYVPLWSHCDDNHAWVEVWCSGEWKFLGACEPEEVLNKGWFTNASSRAMMVHSRWYLPVTPEEDLVGKRKMSLVLNQLKRYALSTTLTIKVVDTEGNPVPKAKVTFEVLNYSCFGEVAVTHTNEEGIATFQTGLGSINIVAYGKPDYGKEAYGEILINTHEQSECTIVIGENKETLDTWEEMHVMAPKDSPINRCVQSHEEIELGRKKTDAAAAKRLAKVAAFYNEEVAEKAIEGYTEEEKARLREIMKQACGNQKEIAEFLTRPTEGNYPESFKLTILNSLREKDYLDTTADTLVEYCLQAVPYVNDYSEDIFVPYILCPRVDNEMIRPCRSFLNGWFTEDQKAELKQNPAKVWEMVSGLITKSGVEYGNLITSVEGALTGGYASIITKKVVAAQILRFLGVPARLNPEDHILEIWKDGEFVALEQRPDVTSGRTAAIIVPESEEIVWTYFQNWTLARFEEGKYHTLMMSPEGGEGVFGELAMFPGKYRIITSNRLPNGNIFAKKMVFELKDGEKKEIILEQMEAQPSDLLEDNDITDFPLTKEDGTQCMVSDLVKDQKGLFIWLEESREPTEHILNEIAQRSEKYQNLEGAKLYFVIKDAKAKDDPTLKRTLTKVSNVEFLYDEFGADMSVLARRMYLEPGKLPLIVIINENMMGIYGSAGYNVGTADMILKILSIK